MCKRRVVITLSYYSPYVSGLTNVARDIAEGLVCRGWEVVVVTTQHDKVLPLEDMLNGVRVVRTPVLFRLGKGVISPKLVSVVVRESMKADVVNIHGPMLEAGIISRLSKSPVVFTYQCDVSLPPTLTGMLQNRVIDFSTKHTVSNAKYVTVTSEDYAENSRLSTHLEPKSVAIPPTCHFRPNGRPIFRESQGLHVGFLGRIVGEKGLEYLLRGFRAFEDPHARLLIAGDFSEIAGGGVMGMLRNDIREDSRVKVLGFLEEDSIKDFYASTDIIALPSVNAFEAFGIVQAEAMMLGIPVVASNLPGVRQPILNTGMGVIVEPRSPEAITQALHKLSNRETKKNEAATLAQSLYGLESTLDKFEDVFIRAI